MMRLGRITLSRFETLTRLVADRDKYHLERERRKFFSMPITTESIHKIGKSNTQKTQSIKNPKAPYRLFSQIRPVPLYRFFEACFDIMGRVVV